VKRDHGPLKDGAASFNIPRWRVVVSLVQSQAQVGQMAFAELYRICWYSLYIFARRRGHLPEDAHDLTRGFFHLLERRALGSVDRLKRKFRSLLLAFFQNHLSDAVDHARRLKRAGSKGPIELDAEDAERRYRRESVESLSAERIFNRWAMTVLGEARNELRQEDAAAGKASTFKTRRVFLYPNNSVARRYHDVLANQLHLSIGGVKALIPSLWNQ
jgi:DNA-directed RNA polymerase specialized sigma24 family protein